MQIYFSLLLLLFCFLVLPSLFQSHLFCWTLPFSKYLTGAKLKKRLNLNSNGNFAFRQGQNDIEDGVHAKVNGGYDGRYADAGPPSANGTNRFVQQPQSQPEQQQQQQEAAAPPAYAVVDKSKKKKKKAVAEDPYAEVEDPRKVRKRSQA